MFGGGEVWMLRTLEALRARGHSVLLCCRPDSEFLYQAKKADISTLEVNFRGDFDPLTIIRLAYYIRRYEIDIILTNMDKELRLSGLAAKLCGRKTAVIPRRGIDYPLKNTLRYRFAYNFLASRIIANSIATKRALLKNAPWLNAERIDVIYNGIEPEIFKEADGRALRVKWGVKDEDLVLGFVGQLDGRKGIGVLLSAYDSIRLKVQNAKLVFVGVGPLREMIESEIRSKGWQNHVILAGFMEEVPQVMKAIDVLALPSYWEGFGIVLIEAMAAQKPVISTNISSMPEIVENGETGYLIKPGDSEELAHFAIELLLNQNKRRAMGEKGQDRVYRLFSQNVMINHLEMLFKNEFRKQRQGNP
ncbi:MAG: glycosyltransferase [bacterium]